MESQSTLDRYQDLLLIYIGLIRKDSPQAAAAIEQMYVSIGGQAALRAALIITILRMEIRQNNWVPDISVHAYLIHPYPEAIPLLEYAMGCCLQAWGIHDLELAHLKMNNPASAEVLVGSSRQ